MPKTYVNRTRKRGTRGKSYIRIACGPQRNRYVHQLVAEALLRRPLRDNEVPDHKNDNSLDNSPSNIRIVTVAANSKYKYGKKHQKPEPLEVVLDGADVWEPSIAEAIMTPRKSDDEDLTP